MLIIVISDIGLMVNCIDSQACCIICYIGWDLDNTIRKDRSSISIPTLFPILKKNYKKLNTNT